MSNKLSEPKVSDWKKRFEEEFGTNLWKYEKIPYTSDIGKYVSCNKEVESFISQEIHTAQIEGMNMLFEAIDKNYHSFMVTEEIGKILIKLKQELEKENV